MQERSDHRNNVFISKKMSYCLRHNPAKYGLKLDEYGFVDLQDFLNAINSMHHFSPKLTEMKIREIMHDSDKERFEIKKKAQFVHYMVIQYLVLLNAKRLFHLKYYIMEQLIAF